MLVVVQRLVKYVIVLYLVTHGLPAAGEIELRDLASAIGWSLLAQLRISGQGCSKDRAAQTGPDARQRTKEAREPYFEYGERAAEGANEADGPVSAALGEEVADHARELVRREGLLQEDGPRVEHAVVHDRVVGVARHVEDLQPRAGLYEAIGEVAPAHLRHDDVGQEQ